MPPLARCTLGSITVGTRSTPPQSTSATLAAHETTLLKPPRMLLIPPTIKFIADSIPPITAFIAFTTPVCIPSQRDLKNPPIASVAVFHAFFTGSITVTLNHADTALHTVFISSQSCLKNPDT